MAGPDDATLAALLEHALMLPQEGGGDIDTRKVLERMQPSPQQKGKVPFYGPGDTYMDRPEGASGDNQYQWPLDPLNNPNKSAHAIVEGTLAGLGGGGDVGSVASGAKQVIGAIPKVPAALGATLAGVLSSPSSSGDEKVPAGQSIAPTGENLRRLYEQQSVLSRQVEEARQRREAQRPQGRAPSSAKDPQFTAADQEFNKLNDQLTGLNQTIRDEQHRGDPAYALEVANKASKDAAEQKAREAATPFRERYPEVAGWLPTVGLALAGATPAAVASARNIRSFFPGSQAGRVQQAIEDNLLARQTGDAANAKLTEAALANHLGDKPTLAGELIKGGAAALAGGGLSAEANLYPDQYDAFNLPPGPLKDQARERALNPLNYFERGGLGALTGLSGYELASNLTPWKAPDWARAQAIVDNPFAAPPPPPPPPPPPRPLGGTQKGHTWDEKTSRWRDADGTFLSGPAPKTK
jgi:hypothetical protein